MIAISAFRVTQHSQIFFTFLQKSNSVYCALSITQFPGSAQLNAVATLDGESCRRPASNENPDL